MPGSFRDSLLVGLTFALAPAAALTAEALRRHGRRAVWWGGTLVVAGFSMAFVLALPPHGLDMLRVLRMVAVLAGYLGTPVLIASWFVYAANDQVLGAAERVIIGTLGGGATLLIGIFVLGLLGYAR